MKSSEIRNRFVKFFESKGHQHINSSSLIPHNDDTLLFANAGMNQFKDIFTGKSNPENRRAVTIQKCVRAGGKHNDLENVGFTARHHTFFEMLGNFSFGDYFKKEAIEFAWEFLTKELNIAEEKLHVTVHYSDDEALEIWRDHIGVPEEKISKKGDKDNFWEMGDVGPCGPCSEIFFDHGEKNATPNYKPGPDQNYLDDEQRYVEIWNLVFMQFEKTGTETIDLPKPSIDTGAGLERIAAAMQGVYWNYDTDLFTPIIDKITELSGKKEFINEKRIVADHIRSTTMLITDGVLPSNEGRGYVLRRIIRRAVRNLRTLEVEFPFMHKLIPTVFEVLGETYPQNVANIELATKLIQQEEEKFLETLDNGLKFFEQAVKSDLKGDVLSGQAIFKLYDTYGFPVDLTELLLSEKNLRPDTKGFEEAMEKRRQESKASWKAGANVDNKVFYSSKEKHGETKFLGYDTTETSGKLLDIIDVGDGLSGLVFDQTPFYGESGGQAGDIGKIYSGDNEIAEILDTTKPVDDFFVHFTKSTNLKVGETYNLKVDSQNRELTKRNHSATHLLQSALIKVLGNHIKQAGSMVNADKLRFDFTHDKGLSSEELSKVELLVNQKVQESLTVTAEHTSFDNALKKGAMALFGEKYGDEVRVLTMGDFSTELCGGTHVSNTSEIGQFLITTESSLSSGVRRMEALTSLGAAKFLKERSETLKQIEDLLKAKNLDAVEKVKSIQTDQKKLKKEIVKLKDQISSGVSTNKYESSVELKNGKKLYFEAVDAETDLRKYSDDFGGKFPQDLLMLTTVKGGKTAVLLRMDKKNSNFSCKDLMSNLLPKFGGRGGGKPDMAQGSCDEVSLDELVKELTALI